MLFRKRPILLLEPQLILFPGLLVGFGGFFEGGAYYSEGGHVYLFASEEVGDGEELDFGVFLLPEGGFVEACGDGFGLHGLGGGFHGDEDADGGLFLGHVNIGVDGLVLLVPGPSVLEGADLGGGAVAVLLFEEDVVVLVAVEGGVEVDEVHGGVFDVAAEDVEVVAVIEGVVQGLPPSCARRRAGP